jgi:hypothetical protein
LKVFFIISLSLLLLLILIPGCVTFQTSPPAATPPVGQPSNFGTPQAVIEFSSNPSTITSGGTSTLLWNVTGANSVSIDQGIGTVNATGTRVVSPATSTIYTISAANAAGTVPRSVVTTVNPAPPPPDRTPPVITEFISYPNSDGTLTLQWNVIGADMVSIDQYIGIVNASGTKVVSPGIATMYTLTATWAIGNWANEIGTVTRSITVLPVASHTPFVQ